MDPSTEAASPPAALAASLVHRAVHVLISGMLLVLLYVCGLVDDAAWELLAGCWLVQLAVQLPPVIRLLNGGPKRRAWLLPGGVAATVGVTLMFSTGWGPLFASGFMILFVGEVTAHGARVWRKALAWVVIPLLVAQLLVVTGAFPSQVSMGIANASFLCGVMVIVMLGRAYGAATERAERELAARGLAEARFRSLVENSHDLVTLVDAEGTVTWVSPAALRVVGYPASQLLGGIWLSLIHPEDGALVQEAQAGLRTSGGQVVTEVRGRHADGTWHWWEVTATNRLDDPAVRAIVCNTRDVTDSRQQQDKLSHQATRDSLTGLLNRAAFLDRFNAALARTSRKEQAAAVLFLDLDDFKSVNDQWGHHVGDQLLQTVATRLQSAVRPGDTVGRLAGDEFVILLEDLNTGSDAEAVADRVRLALASPVVIEDQLVAPRASVGLAVTTSGLEKAEELLQLADLRMYEAKQALRRQPRRPAVYAGGPDAETLRGVLPAGSPPSAEPVAISVFVRMDFLDARRAANTGPGDPDRAQQAADELAGRLRYSLPDLVEEHVASDQLLLKRWALHGTRNDESTTGAMTDPWALLGRTWQPAP